MEFVRFKFAVNAPRPEARYLAGSDDELRVGMPNDRTRTLETGSGSWPATFDSVVQVTIEPCDAGRCAHCRENARVRYVLRSSDQHGIKKWCGPCLREWYAVDVPG